VEAETCTRQCRPEPEAIRCAEHCGGGEHQKEVHDNDDGAPEEASAPGFGRVVAECQTQGGGARICDRRERTPPPPEGSLECGVGEARTETGNISIETDRAGSTHRRGYRCRPPIANNRRARAASSGTAIFCAANRVERDTAPLAVGSGLLHARRDVIAHPLRWALKATRADHLTRRGRYAASAWRRRHRRMSVTAASASALVAKIHVLTMIGVGVAACNNGSRLAALVSAAALMSRRGHVRFHCGRIYVLSRDASIRLRTAWMAIVAPRRYFRPPLALGVSSADKSPSTY
jgi:hypothetical protein